MAIFIIAEIGINHNGNLDLAKQLIDLASDCGCDAVKFQKRDIDLVYTKEFLDSPRKSPWVLHSGRKKKDSNLASRNLKISTGIVKKKILPGLHQLGI